MSVFWGAISWQIILFTLFLQQPDPKWVWSDPGNSGYWRRVASTSRVLWFIYRARVRGWKPGGEAKKGGNKKSFLGTQPKKKPGPFFWYSTQKKTRPWPDGRNASGWYWRIPYHPFLSHPPPNTPHCRRPYLWTPPFNKLNTSIGMVSGSSSTTTCATHAC